LIIQATFGVRLVALPSLSRTLKRLLEITLAMVVITSLVHGAGLPFSLLAAEAVGWGVGHDRAPDPRLADRCPRPDDIACLLDDSKISASSVAPAPNRKWGSTRYVATGSVGKTPSISLYGRDAGLSQLPADTYRTVVHHRDVGPFALTRVQQIEHEAYMTLLAQRAAPGRTAALATTGFAGPSHEAVVVSISPKCRVQREMLAVGGAPCGRAVP